MKMQHNNKQDKHQIAMEEYLFKTIDTQEIAVKDQYIRSIIDETYEQKGAVAFWDCIPRLPLQENGIACWKFCHVLHKVLQEGHSNALVDSQPFNLTLLDYGHFWDRSKNDPYGVIAKLYCSLLNHKLNFHMRNNKIPGNLKMNNNELLKCVTGSDRGLFKVSLEMFDYLDVIIELQREIFKEMDNGRSNSMTNSGQCKLKPLLICIEDAMILYDHTTKIIHQLHEKGKIPEHELRRHRERSEAAFWDLKKFCEKMTSFQYCRNLIEIQQLSKNPPNFMCLSDILDNYVVPEIIFHNLEQDIQSDAFTFLANPLLSDAHRSSLKEIKMKELENDIERLTAELHRLRMEPESSNGDQSNENEMKIPELSHKEENKYSDDLNVMEQVVQGKADVETHIEYEMVANHVKTPNFGWTIPKSENSSNLEKNVSSADDRNRECGNANSQDASKGNPAINLIEEIEKHHAKKQLSPKKPEVQEDDYESSQTAQLRGNATVEPEKRDAVSSSNLNKQIEPVLISQNDSGISNSEKQVNTPTTKTNNSVPTPPPPPPQPNIELPSPTTASLPSLTDSRLGLLNEIRNFNSKSLKAKTEKETERPVMKPIPQSQRESLMSSLQDRMKEMRPHIAQSDEEDEFSDEF